MPRLIAYYLPQFHPIPENDVWWGKGFTEWTNVARARPLYDGHYQPRVPADLGFYDLRLPEARAAQAQMAQEYGIGGFCYWHYWFSGRKLLERPFREVLSLGEPDFPFCLGWANQSWSGIWHGAPDRLLIEQTYPGTADDDAHFRYVLGAFQDPRYIRVEGKPLFLIYKPTELPSAQRFTDRWRELALREGLAGIYFVADSRGIDWDLRDHGFDACVLANPSIVFRSLVRWDFPGIDRSVWNRALTRIRRTLAQSPSSCSVYAYSEYIAKAPMPTHDFQFPCVVPNWDDTPRRGWRGRVLHESSPALYERHLRTAVESIRGRTPEESIVFVKSWNEWAEGNHLEPDLKHGRAYLEATRRVLASASHEKYEAQGVPVRA